MNFNKNNFDIKYLIKNASIFREKYITKKSSTELIDNYAKICTLKRPDDTYSNVYVELEIYAKAWGHSKKATYTISIYYDTKVNYSIIGQSATSDFELFGDVVDGELNIYLKSNKKGANFVTIVNAGSLMGFVTMYQYSTFSFLETQFTQKITAYYNTTEYRSSVSIESNVSSSFSIVRGTLGKLLAYVSNNGVVRIGKHKFEETGNYDTSIDFETSSIKINLPAGGSLIPVRNASNSNGTSDNKWKNGFYNNGISIGRTSAPTEVYDDMVYIDAVNKKLRYYKSGKWYSVSLTAE